MLFLLLNCLLVCFALCVVTVFGDDIDEDYFFGTVSLRTQDTPYNCQTPSDALMCQLRCSNLHVCLDKKCLCLNLRTVNVPRIQRSRIEPPRADYQDNPPGFLDLTRLYERQEEPPRPALRHHIAHFCPNLDEARVCIRKCMAVGKPAFCGKDHVCYCGHRYLKGQKTNKDDPQNAKVIYAQFQDLYKKYFGDNYNVDFNRQD